MTYDFQSEQEKLNVSLDDLNIKSIAPEAFFAAHWWAEKLRISPQLDDLGGRRDPYAETMELFAYIAKRNNPALSEAFINRFEYLLTLIIQYQFVQSEAWAIAVKDDRPIYGSGYRVLAVDYGGNGPLRAAFQAAGGKIDVSVFPDKTTMFVNPGSIRVRQGYSGKDMEIYAAVASR